MTGIMLSYRQDLQISSMSNMLIFLACKGQGVEGVYLMEKESKMLRQR